MKQIITFFIIFFVLNSCQTSAALDSSLKREWMLIEFPGFTKEQLVKHKARLAIHVDDKYKNYKATAYLGCNALNYTLFATKSQKLKVDRQNSTERDCNDNQLESQFASYFNEIVHYNVEGHFLSIRTESGKVLRFVASDWD